ncbi:hypothetical protein C8R44DRAFT_762487 [Mycena epipterygia]|nr:hypothetical protein C8R44DRAFT_762487 [Mycena epipterygia]
MAVLFSFILTSARRSARCPFAELSVSGVCSSACGSTTSPCAVGVRSREMRTVAASETVLSVVPAISISARARKTVSSSGSCTTSSKRKSGWGGKSAIFFRTSSHSAVAADAPLLSPTSER